jgi:hypothetical protein
MFPVAKWPTSFLSLKAFMTAERANAISLFGRGAFGKTKAAS